MSYKCAPCIRNITLISLTGGKFAVHDGRLSIITAKLDNHNIFLYHMMIGDIDAHVTSEMTNIFSIAPRPVNISTIPPNGPTLRTFDIIQMIRKPLELFLKGSISKLFPKSGTSNIAASDSSNNGTSRSDSINSTHSAADPPNKDEAKPFLNESNPFAFITLQGWKQYIMNYSEPHHYAIRASAIDGIDFPIDHFAILWCYEFLEVVNTAIKELVRVKDRSIIDISYIHRIFKLKESSKLSKTMEEVSLTGITDLQKFIGRNISNELWMNSSSFDSEFIKERAGNNYVLIVAIRYFTQKLYQPIQLLCILSLFSLATIYINGLSLLPRTISFDYYAMPPLEFYFKLLAKIITFSTKGFSVLNFFVALIAVYSGSLMFKSGINIFLELTMKFVLEAMLVAISLFIALFIRILLTTFIRCVRYIGTVFLLMARLNWIRVLQKVVVDKIYGKKSKGTFLFGIATIEIYVTIFMMILIYYKGRSSVYCYLDPGFMISFFCVLLYVLITLTTFFGLLLGCGLVDSIENSHQYQVQNELTLVYVLVTIGTFPSFMFACGQLFSTEKRFLYESALYDSFVTERINLILALLACWLTIRRLFDSKNLRAPLEVKFLSQFIQDSSAEILCLHEDGGPSAVFEKIDDFNYHKLISKGIVIGSTYKVVWCNCRANKAFKSEKEWCEWCRCPRCGSSKKYFPEASNNDVVINLDLLLITGFYACMVYIWVLGDHKLYLISYFFGITSGLLYVRSLFATNSVNLARLLK